MHKDKLLILHVSERIKGGTAAYLNEILEFQSAEFGIECVHALMPERQVKELRKTDKICLNVFKDTSVRIFDAINMMLQFRKLTKMYKYDIIHIHCTFAGAALRLYFGWRKQQTKIIYCAHGWAFDMETDAWKNCLIGYIEKVLSYWTDAVICISEHDYQSAIRVGLPKRKLVTIINAISPEYESHGTVEWPIEKRRFLFVGRFDRQKGMDIFLDAMRQIGAYGFAYAIGDASNSDTELDFPDNVVGTGWLAREVVQGYLESCDVFVIPSRWEGFGLSALEAMRAGKLLIASRVGGLPELVKDGVNGFLINKNSVEELVMAMRNITEQDVDVMGKASRQRFEQYFTIDRLNMALVELYTQ